MVSETVESGMTYITGHDRSQLLSERVGVVVKSVSQPGVSTAVGRKKSSRLAFVKLPASS